MKHKKPADTILGKIWESFKKEEVSVISLFVIMFFLLVGNNIFNIKAGGVAVPVMVKDINVGAGNSVSGVVLTELNGGYYFTADDGINGEELWVTDGTEVGTAIVKDICPGACPSSPRWIINMNNVLYFAADDGTNGIEFWKSDGTEVGTLIVDDFYSGVNSFYPQSLTIMNNVLYFSAVDSSGQELWKSDGTASGTVMVKDIASGVNSSGVVNFIVLNDVFYFKANDAINGAELWKSDGTEGGTVMVKDINPGAGSDIQSLININGVLYFIADDGINGVELWKSDGTEGGTLMVKDINISGDSYPNNLVNAGGIIYFSANDGINGAELWKSDGTEGGTTIVKDIYIGGDSEPSDLFYVNNILYFIADDGINGFELWKSDGTEEGTVMVKDINSSGESFIFNFKEVSGVFYFSANDGINGQELWKSDGTASGTVMITDINPSGDSSLAHLINVDGVLYFDADDGVHGRELWKYVPDPLPTQTQTLSYTAGANGYISGSSTQVVAINGTGQVVTAVANAGYHFVEWSDSSTNNPRIDSGVTNNVTVTASFAANTATTQTSSGGASFFASASTAYSNLVTEVVSNIAGSIGIPTIQSTSNSNSNQITNTRSKEEDEDREDAVLAHINTEATFTVPVSKETKEQKHTIKTVKINKKQKSATIRIESKPQIFDLNLGEKINVDLNEDNVYDISVEFTSLHGDSPEWIVRSLIKEDNKINTTTSTSTYVLNRDYKVETITKVVKNKKEDKTLLGIELPNISSVPISPSFSNNLSLTEYMFTRDYKIGMIGEEVRNLQRFLNKNGFLIKQEGIGSFGKESNVFGPYTNKSLKEFQRANNIYPADGFFGPVTRDYINRNFVRIRE